MDNTDSFLQTSGEPQKLRRRLNDSKGTGAHKKVLVDRPRQLAALGSSRAIRLLLPLFLMNTCLRTRFSLSKISLRITMSTVLRPYSAVLKVSERFVWCPGERGSPLWSMKLSKAQLQPRKTRPVCHLGKQGRPSRSRINVSKWCG